jgi:AraC-like DNA-binding protein
VELFAGGPENTMDAFSEILAAVKLKGAHSRVSQLWTIADLAREVGLSRSALVDRFSRFLAVPPMAYLTQWRLQLAARALTTTPRGIADIAADVGYESEAAFNRAFKREFKLPPARYRREAKQPTGNGEVEEPTELTPIAKPSIRLS